MAAENLPQVAPSKQSGVTHPQAGVWLFRVRSFSDPSTHYLAQFIRRRGWFCTCPDFTYRKLGRTRHCKHLRALRTLAALKHGVSNLAEQLEEVSHES